MSTNFKLFFIAFITMILLNGCIHRELVISSQNASQDSTQESTDASTDADSADLDKGLIRRIPFPDSEYATLAKKGKGTVKGLIYILDDNGKKIYGKKTRLYLNPVTSYSKQWYDQSYIGGYKMGKSDKKLFNYLKFTSSNSSGKFAFYGVPSGSYYLIGTVRCGSQCGYESMRDIRIAKEVRVNGTDTVSVDLNRMTY